MRYQLTPCEGCFACAVLVSEASCSAARPSGMARPAIYTLDDRHRHDFEKGPADQTSPVNGSVANAGSSDDVPRQRNGGTFTFSDQRRIRGAKAKFSVPASKSPASGKPDSIDFPSNPCGRPCWAVMLIATPIGTTMTRHQDRGLQFAASARKTREMTFTTSPLSFLRG